MPLLIWIVLFTLLGGVLSVVAASIFLSLPEAWRQRVIPHAISFAIGALLGAAFLALLPHALSGGFDPHRIMLAVLLGVLGFFLLEKLVLWRHCHGNSCSAVAHDNEHRFDPHHHAHGGEHNHRHNASGILILVGDSIHNFVDGVLIAAAFLTDIELGIVTALAVAAHEIPQEVGDFAVLLHSGFKRGKAFLYNIISSLTTVLGGVLAYHSLADTQQYLPFVLAIAASSFIYIAVADLIPGLHRRLDIRGSLQQITLIGAGVGLIFLAHSTLH
ncbi:MAG TPA: ZIP family metal transporter [Gammaproteobacteria bacterium]